MNKIYRQITQCRVCGNKHLTSVLHLGQQYLTGVFPKTKGQDIPRGPLELVKCIDTGNKGNCGLLQLKHSYEPTILYGESYGYRSSLNQSMVSHLQQKVEDILSLGVLKTKDLVVDVGSNDGTLLKCYPPRVFELVGVDPSGGGFRKYYPAHIRLITDFFSKGVIKQNYPGRKVKVLTSIAMFYDLKAPVAFMRQVHDILDDEGIWVLEQSYLPRMIEQLAYDTVCHEHLEYYGLKQIDWMARKAGFNILKVILNDINGGSFEVILSKKRQPTPYDYDRIKQLLAKEDRRGLATLKPYARFKQNVFVHRDKLRQKVNKINKEGKRIIGYGASTKGNVLLQLCRFTTKDIPFIAEVNKDKIGAYTPGSRIPIISEKRARAMKPEYMLVLPWHFKDHIVAREQAYLRNGGRLIFPLPQLEIVGV